MAVGGTLDDGSQLSDEEVGGVAQMAVTEEHSTISCCSLKQAGQRYGMRCDLGGRQRSRAGGTGCGEGGGAAWARGKVGIRAGWRLGEGWWGS